MVANHPDLIFLQMSPADFIVRQRFLSHKCALNEVEDYVKHGVESMDPVKPITWEECLVNLVVLDMLRENKTPGELHLPKGFSTYAYPYLQNDATRKQLTVPFMESITKNIVGSSPSEYSIINHALYTSLMGKHKVLLGDMPELLYRQQLGNSLTLKEFQDLFKFIKGKMAELKEPITFREAAVNFAPHIFQLPRDLYMSALLKEALQAATCIVAMVGMPHYTPVKKYWVGPPHGINFEEACRIPDRLSGESDENLIEKQALLDVLLEKRAWGDRYISNPFPYLVNNIAGVSQEELAKMKKCFLTNYHKYESFKNMSYRELDGKLHSVNRLPKFETKIGKEPSQNVRQSANA
eukprot:TRINITY_DN5716_c0_g1_i3.p1 TRINITY_DN5716_c0_g1~~TRINITY_DN5716_c0_g1_i3.p1  ORF type:complete len:352 (-),score=86.07 TRINITY_DN5716_c0_g1_i3:87-1142(-)